MNIQAIKSTSTPLPIEPAKLSDSIADNIKSLEAPIYYIAYHFHTIHIGELVNKQISDLDKQYIATSTLREMRLFSSNGELYIWQDQNKLRARLRLDDEGDDVEICDQSYYTWGDERDGDDLNTVKEKNRGMKITFPFEITNVKLPVQYKVRHYLAYDNNQILQFKDARIKCFVL